MNVFVLVVDYDSESYAEPCIEGVFRTRAAADARARGIVAEFAPSDVASELYVSVEEHALED
jgi:hypothetical protein